MTEALDSGSGQVERAGLVAGVLAMVMWSTGIVMAKGIELPGLAVVSYRMILYVGGVIVWARWRGTPLTRLGVRVAFWGGTMLGLDLAFFYVAVKETTVANVTVIAACQPLLALVIGPIFFDERPRRRDVALAVIAVTGVALVVFGSSGLPEWSARGDVFGVFALVFFTLYFASAKVASGKVSPTEYTAGSAFWATVVVVPVALVAQVDLGPPGASTWAALVALALVPGMLGHLLMNFSISKVPLWLSSTLTLFVPAIATLLAYVFLDESVGATQFLGMGIVIGSLMAVIARPGSLKVLRPGPSRVSPPR